jgi:hypothetical protein
MSEQEILALPPMVRMCHWRKAIGVSAKTIANWAKKGVIPPPRIVGRHTRLWPREALVAFLREGSAKTEATHA